ncbi:hypothetical protein HZA33_04405 [Candidatus Pacearchaeota archaeon]|nr:hypothetical protein [Candidatus Pacearchaeota archaeon]
MEKSNLWTIVVITIVVAVVASLATLSLTGNIVKVATSKFGPPVYNTSEIDAKFASLKGSCQYIHYKDSIYSGYNLDNMTIIDVCQKILGGFVPKIIVETESKYLYNRQNCSPSYSIYGKTADSLISYKTELAGVKLGQSTSNACDNAVFPDGSNNGNYSTQTYRLYSGVLCCKN